jgi:putative zinc finger/helix-turn-helix YgiT family protein
MLCQKCRGRMRRRKASRVKPYHFSECGLENVYLVGIYLFECPRCGEQLPEIPNIVKIHDALGAVLVTKPALLDGREIRYLRKNLGLKAADFAEYLQTTPVSVSRWETGEQAVSKENDNLIRYFYLRYKEETTRRRFREALVERLRHIAREQRPLTLNVELGPRGMMSTEFVEASATG